MQLPISNTPCGIVHVDSGTESHLPLESADIHADIVDVSARVTITQCFWQSSPSALSQAKYVFPVPSRAAICGFEMITEDGTVVTAVVKEKGVASTEHHAAIREGRMTGLVAHATDDIFSLSLGALPAEQIITTKVTLVLDIMNDDASDQVRLQLPMCIGARYGPTPAEVTVARTIPSNRINISVDVHMQGAVKEITSPTHPTILTSTRGSTMASQEVQYTSPEFMSQDFVLVISAEGLDAPRCLAERTSNGTMAMQLTVVPKFDLPSVPRQEYIFLVDRSGSMDGARIKLAKRALVLLLRALPSQGTWFNIYGFGNRCTGLWEKSVQYDEKSMLHATEHIDAMTADAGGTETRKALQTVLQSRKMDIPSAVFVLTDGEDYDIDNTMQPVEQAVNQSVNNQPLRVFTLGIGETTSSALCEGLARSGNGICLMATTTESILGKCSRLVRASRTYILKNVSVDWGIRNELAEATQIENTQPKAVLQAPVNIRAIYPGNRFIVFAFVGDLTFAPPREVVIRAQRDGQGQMLQFKVPVHIVDQRHGTCPRPLVQTLAARQIIMDIEANNRDDIPPDAKASIIHLGTQYQLVSRYTSFVAVHNCVPPGGALATSTLSVPDELFLSTTNPSPPTAANHPDEWGWTAPASWTMTGMQVEDEEEEDWESTPHLLELEESSEAELDIAGFDQSHEVSCFSPLPEASTPGDNPRSPSPPYGVAVRGHPSMSMTWTHDLPSGLRRAGTLALSSTEDEPLGGAGIPDEPSFPPARTSPSATAHPWAAPSSAAIDYGDTLLADDQTVIGAEDKDGDEDEESGFHTMSGAYPAYISRSSDESEGLSEGELEIVSTSFMPRGASRFLRCSSRSGDESEPDDSGSAANVSVQDRIIRLVRLQSFDGAFPSDSRLLVALGDWASLAEAEVLGVPGKIWATVLAMAFLKQYSKDQPELLEALLEKAMEYISQSPGIDVASLLDRATAALNRA